MFGTTPVKPEGSLAAVLRFERRSRGNETAVKLPLLLAVVAAFAATNATAKPPAPTFSAKVGNAWFPLVSGSRYVYVGVKDGLPSRDVVTVTHAVRVIAGAP
jgi:hypothetical protein